MQSNKPTYLYPVLILPVAGVLFRRRVSRVSLHFLLESRSERVGDVLTVLSNGRRLLCQEFDEGKFPDQKSDSDVSNRENGTFLTTSD